MKSKQELLNMVEEYNILLNKVTTPKEDFITRLYNFDWYYGYTDDGNVYRARFEEQIKLKEESKQFGLEFVFSKSHDKRNVWFDEQEIIKIYKREMELKRNKDVKFLIKGNDYEELVFMNETIKEFLKLFGKLSEYRAGYFVYTPKTDVKSLREYFLRTDYSGITLPNKLQEEITEYFKDIRDLIRAINLSCDNHYGFAVGNSVARFSFDVIPETESVVLEVGCYPRMYRFII